VKREDEITVTIKDLEGKVFSKDWKNGDDKRNTIRWTLENGDVPHYLDISKISQITIDYPVEIVDVSSAYPTNIINKEELQKIICVDNYDRELYSDRLVCENLNGYYAKHIVDLLNSREGENSQDFYKAVPLDYKLYEYEWE
jgi:hypothetical protein